MKKIVAISDTHLTDWRIPKRLEDLMDNADLVVHAGDFETYNVYKDFTKYDLVAVRGDSDDEKISAELPDIEVFRVEGVKFGLVHKGNYLNEFHDLGYKAMELGVDVLIFGHVHRFVLEKFKNVLVLCPGSPTKPRLSIATCAEIVVSGNRVMVNCRVVQDLYCGMV